MKLLFIGGGNMARAIIGGLTANGYAADQITVVEPIAELREVLKKDFAVNTVPQIENVQCAVVILAVKPQVMHEAVAPLVGKLGEALVISIAAGIRLNDLSRWLGGHQNIVRAMPNTPALIHAGVTGMFASSAVTVTQRQHAESLLNAVGKTRWFDDEAMLDAVTAVSGSGPAYVFYFIEALELAALELGFNAETAREFALETFRGATLLACQSPESAAILRQRVTSKRGTTECAIAAFDTAQLKEKFVFGVKAAALRSHQLGLELSQASSLPDKK